MKTITPESLADVEFQLNWNSKDARHEERLFTTINLWRDIFPPGFYAALLGKIPGDKIGPFMYDREKSAFTNRSGRPHHLEPPSVPVR